MRKLMMISGLGLLAACAILAGCEWTAGSTAETWGDAGSWADFSGAYRAADNGILVRQFGTTIVTNIVTESLGSGDGTKTEFSGALSKTVLSGTLIITAGGYKFTDSSVASNATGTVNLSVTPADGSSGTFNYSTRVWTLKFPAPLSYGAAIAATYSSIEIVSDTANQGNHGAAIYSFIIYGQGNVMQIIDSNNNTYNGSLGAIRSTGGASPPASSGPVDGQFSATGTANGYSIQIVGILTANCAVTTANNISTYSLSNRRMRATYIEIGGYTADINALAQ